MSQKERKIKNNIGNDKNTHHVSRREFLKGAGLVVGGATIASLALSSACDKADTQNPTDTANSTNTTPATTTSETTSTANTTPFTTPGGTPPATGGYVPPDTYPDLIDTLGCTTKVANDRVYSIEHIWAKTLGGDQVVVIGITDKFQALMDTVTYFDFNFKTGTTIKRGDAFASAEAYKLNTDLYSPVSGKILQENTALMAIMTPINSFPYTKGWMMVIQMTKPEELNDLVSPAYYAYLQAKEPPTSIPPMH